MILTNPISGATIKTVISGKEWFFPKETTQSFPDEIGIELLKLYGFLKKVKNEPTSIENVAEGFKCSSCDYQNKVKIAVFQHVKTHSMGEVKEAQPVGEAKRRPTLYEERNKAQGIDVALEREHPGIEFYGEGFEEIRAPLMHNFTGGLGD